MIGYDQIGTHHTPTEANGRQEMRKGPKRLVIHQHLLSTFRNPHRSTRSCMVKKIDMKFIDISYN